MRDTDGDKWAAPLTWEAVVAPLGRGGSKTGGEKMGGSRSSLCLSVAIASRAGVGGLNER